MRAMAAVMPAAAMRRGCAAEIMFVFLVVVEERRRCVAAGAAVRGKWTAAPVIRYLTMRKAVVAFALPPPAMARAVIVRR